MSVQQPEAKSTQHRDVDFGAPVIVGLIRGMLPFALLTLIQGRPLHGTELIRAITDMTDGAWTPSPGSVYPVLRKLEQGGHISGAWRRTRSAPRRVYRLTQKGHRALPGMRQRLVGQLESARYLIDQHLAILTAEQ